MISLWSGHIIWIYSWRSVPITDSCISSAAVILPLVFQVFCLLYKPHNEELSSNKKLLFFTKILPVTDLGDYSLATKDMATSLWNLGHFSVPDEKLKLHKLHFILGSFLCFPKYSADNHYAWQTAIKAQVQWNPAWLPASSWLAVVKCGCSIWDFSGLFIES